MNSVDLFVILTGLGIYFQTIILRFYSHVDIFTFSSLLYIKKKSIEHKK